MELKSTVHDFDESTVAIKSRFRISRFQWSYFLPLQVASRETPKWRSKMGSNGNVASISSPDQHLIQSGINGKCYFSSRAYFVPLTLILPSMICQQSSALSLLSLFESSLQRLLIMPIYYILSVLMPSSLLYLPSMTSIRYLFAIC
jgi:hypothetical protein